MDEEIRLKRGVGRCPWESSEEEVKKESAEVRRALQNDLTKLAGRRELRDTLFIAVLPNLCNVPLCWPYLDMFHRRCCFCSLVRKAVP